MTQHIGLSAWEEDAAIFAQPEVEFEKSWRKQKDAVIGKPLRNESASNPEASIDT